MIDEGYLEEHRFSCGCLSEHWGINEPRMKAKWKLGFLGIRSPIFHFSENEFRLVLRKKEEFIEIFTVTGNRVEEGTFVRIFLKDCSAEGNCEVKSSFTKTGPNSWSSVSILLPISAISCHETQYSIEKFIKVCCELENFGCFGHEPNALCRTEAVIIEEKLQDDLQDEASQNEATDNSTETGGIHSLLNIRKLQQDYKKLFHTSEEADVCLRVREKEFRAHKCILRARSTVFDAMFKHQMKEAASGEVIIEDLDADSFPVFLEFLYAGSADGLSESNACNLFTAADKYDMQELKSECKAFIKDTLSPDTFCDVMVLALKHRDEEMLSLATDYFSKNLSQIIMTVKWQNFLLAHGIEANELLIKALGSKEK